MSAHTPGPWVKSGPYQMVGGGRCLSIDGGGITVATVGANDEDLAPAHADASLIAAAPELLEALKAVVEQFVGIDHHRDECPGLLAHDGVTVLGPVCRDHQVAALVDSAIAKAEGK